MSFCKSRQIGWNVTKTCSIQLAAMVGGHVTAPTALFSRLEVGVDGSIPKFRAATLGGVAWQTSEARSRAPDAYAGFLLWCWFDGFSRNFFLNLPIDFIRMLAS
jgi:hypothetical protein